MADPFEDEAEQTVSIHEYLKDVEEQELEADLVLGGDEGKKCTYDEGYMKRQAVFSCLTCTPDGNAGVCTACSLSCHDGHEIVELWTKRNFRCDCGNSKFGQFFCKLIPNKDTENVENSYNHNFKGSYCTCGRPYPDPDVEDQVEMMQCLVCEDWFHEEHLGLDSADEIPRDEDGEPLYEDFICQSCSVICNFLANYPKTIYASSACGPSGNIENNNGIYNSPKEDNALTDTTPDTMSLVGAVCLLLGKESEQNTVVNPPELDRNKPKPMFLAKNWRDSLCTCEKCVNLFIQKGIRYLLDKEDSIVEYEKMAKQKREEKLQQQEGVECNFLNNLGHVQKIEILNGIADMKNEIHSFLESFDSSKPITSADVHQVFENLAKKRKRV